MRFARTASILVVAIVAGRARFAAAWDPEQEQGTHLQTPEFDSFYIEPTKNGGKTISAPGGELKIAGEPPKIGRTLQATTTDLHGKAATLNVIVMKIGKHANPYNGPTHVPHEYQIVYGDDNKPLCGKENNWALAIPGSYSTSFKGIYDPNTNGVSFACIPRKTGKVSGHDVLTGGGVAAKCVDWGYPPWFFTGAPWVGHTAAGKTLKPKDDIAQKMHQTCLSMGTADYCGKGIPHTVDGTWIAMFNDHNVGPVLDQQAKPHLKAVLGSKLSGPFRFEAAWRPPSMNQATKTLIAGGAFCVTKARWATMPPELSTNCPGLNEAGLEPFCEQFTEKELELDHNALLFSYSLFLDLGLYRCKNGQSWLTSTTDDLEPLGQFKLVKAYDKDGYHCGEDDFEGTVLRWGAEEAPLPENFPKWKEFVKLYLHKSASGQYKTDTVADGTQDPIGYILPVTACQKAGSPWCGKPLKLYQKNAKNEYLTTTMSQNLPQNFSEIEVLGHLIDLKAN